MIGHNGATSGPLWVTTLLSYWSALSTSATQQTYLHCAAAASTCSTVFSHLQALSHSLWPLHSFCRNLLFLCKYLHCNTLGLQRCLLFCYSFQEGISMSVVMSKPCLSGSVPAILPAADCFLVKASLCHPGLIITCMRMVICNCNTFAWPGSKPVIPKFEHCWVVGHKNCWQKYSLHKKSALTFHKCTTTQKVYQHNTSNKYAKNALNHRMCNNLPNGLKHWKCTNTRLVVNGTFLLN